MRLRRRTLWLGIVGAYVALVTLSHAVAPEPGGGAGPGLARTRLPVHGGDASRPEEIELAWEQWGEDGGRAGLPTVLLHGSPGGHGVFRLLAADLDTERRLLAPDLPGFGASTRGLPDYSIRSHAAYVDDWLETLGVEQAHFVGFSMGGGVALEVFRRNPSRVASLTLLSSIGVQEMELLGSYALNHLVHGAQLAGLWVLHNAFPHMGLLTNSGLDVPYARNFYDTDQRPLRGLLQTFEPPVLIVHGREDFLVPSEAAVEHHRLAAHSELEMLEASHFFIFMGDPPVAPLLADFWARVEAGTAARRADATAERRALAAAAYDPASAPRWMGPALLVVILLLALSTFVSEDLTCIGAGLLAAQGRLDFWTAVFACFLGIFVGDVLLFWAGRRLGRPALRYPPLRWWLTPDAVEVSSAWFRRRGAIVIGISRFLPGTRLATYFTAGVLRTSFVQFAAYMAVAVGVWTPLLVGFSQAAGGAALERLGALQRGAFFLILVPLMLLVAVRTVIVPLLSWSGRRRLLGGWRRRLRWEFWPPWLFYPPLLPFFVGQAVQHRSMTVFTAANPALPAGGFVGESKAQILEGLNGAGEALPNWAAVPSGPLVERLARVEQAAGGAVGWPAVLKPDVGQRGDGVAIVADLVEASEHLEKHPEACVVQTFVPGLEFGIFYFRRPGQEHGEIFSITEKQTPCVEGDGVSSLRQLILRDRRASMLWRVYFREAPDLEWVPAVGESVPLTKVGAHSRGTIFRDGTRHRTAALVETIDRISLTYDGFFFGRYDVRVPTVAALREGRELRILELNGVTSEATDIYDPEHGPFQAWAQLRRQWRLAFQIGAANRDLGHPVTSVAGLVRLVFRHRDQIPW